MRSHKIRLVFNNRVVHCEAKIALIAEQIKTRFGNQVNVELPLSKNRNVEKFVYLHVGGFDDAMTLADQIGRFLCENETAAALQKAGIHFSTRCVDSQYAQGWCGTFAQKFIFA